MSFFSTSNLRYWLLAILIVITDQISKYAVLRHFQFAERRIVLPDFFDLTLVYNTGAAFSFLAGAGGWQKYFFILLALIISLWLAKGIVGQELGSFGRWGAAMVIGGAHGNLIDRFIHGHVIDFLLFYWKNWHYPAFNVADSFICIGAALLVIDNFKHKRQDDET